MVTDPPEPTVGDQIGHDFDSAAAGGKLGALLGAALGAVAVTPVAILASPELVVLVGAGVMVPIILAYTGWAYWVFRGKVGHEGYH